MPGLLFAHLRNRLLRYEEISGDVRADHHFKIFGRIFGEGLRNIDACAVDEEIDAAEMPDGGISHFDRRFLFADVTVHQDQIPGGFQLL